MIHLKKNNPLGIIAKMDCAQKPQLWGRSKILKEGENYRAIAKEKVDLVMFNIFNICLVINYFFNIFNICFYLPWAYNTGCWQVI